MQSATNLPAPHLEVLSRNPTHATFAYGNLIIASSSASPTISDLEPHVTEVLRYGARYPNGLGLLILIAPDEPPPNELTRQALRSVYTTLRRVIKASVLVVEGEGFMASAKRSVITLFASSPLQPFPMKVAGTATEAAEKLVKMLGPALDPRLNVPLIAATVPAVRAQVAASTG